MTPFNNEPSWVAPKDLSGEMVLGIFKAGKYGIKYSAATHQGGISQ